MKRLLTVLLASTPLAAHMLSISTGSLRVEGNEVRYELRMPLYEVEYIEQPEQTLFGHFSLASRGEQGALRERSCREVRRRGVCLPGHMILPTGRRSR
jgi:hypothetical protein